MDVLWVKMKISDVLMSNISAQFKDHWVPSQSFPQSFHNNSSHKTIFLSTTLISGG